MTSDVTKSNILNIFLNLAFVLASIDNLSNNTKKAVYIIVLPALVNLKKCEKFASPPFIVKFRLRLIF